MTNFEDILARLQDLGEKLVDTLQPSGDFKDVMRTSNMDFHELRKEIASLFRHGKETGYSELAAGQIRISLTEEKDVFNVAIEVYFLNGEEPLQKISKQYSVYGFSYMPESARRLLDEGGLVKITFDADELMDIMASMDKEVYDSKYYPLSHWIDKAVKSASKHNSGQYRVKIDDMALYYRVRIYVLTEEGEEQYRTEFLVAHLVDIDKLVQEPDIDAIKRGYAIYFDQVYR